MRPRSPSGEPWGDCSDCIKMHGASQFKSQNFKRIVWLVRLWSWYASASFGIPADPLTRSSVCGTDRGSKPIAHFLKFRLLSRYGRRGVWLQCMAPHSGDWLLALPSHLRLEDEALWVAVVARLGVGLCVTPKWRQAGMDAWRTRWALHLWRGNVHGNFLFQRFSVTIRRSLLAYHESRYISIGYQNITFCPIGQ